MSEDYFKVINELNNKIKKLNKFLDKMQFIHLHNKRLDICNLFPEYIFEDENIFYAIPLKYCR